MSDTDHLDPAARIITAFGGPRRVAEITGADRSQITRWRLAKSRGGYDGVIPRRHAVVLLHHAKAHGIAVTADDFLGMSAPADAAE